MDMTPNVLLHLEEKIFAVYFDLCKKKIGEIYSFHILMFFILGSAFFYSAANKQPYTQYRNAVEKRLIVLLCDLLSFKSFYGPSY